MVNIRGYNPIKDIQSVEQFGYIDLQSALVNNCVPSDIGNTDASYNDIEDPAAILGRPRDVFEAAHLERTIRDYKPSATQTEENPA